MKHVSIKTAIRDISFSRKRRVDVFRSLALAEQVVVAQELSRHVLRDLVMRLEIKEVVAILEQLDPDIATDILRVVPEKKRQKIVTELNEQAQKDISLLLSFEPNTAADLMSLDYIFVEESDTIAGAAKKVQVHESRTGKLPTILVLSDQKLVGYIPGYKLGIAHPNDELKSHVRPIVTVSYTVGQNEVLNLFERHPHSKVVVLGRNENVLGIIYSDDIIRLLQQRESASLYDFAGINEEESVYDSARRKIKFRYKWLILNLGTAFLAAFTVGLFEETISREVLLAVYMPIVAGMGGNAGTQTLAVMVRGMTMQSLGWKSVFRILRNEVGAGVVNGALNGLIVFCIVYFFKNNLLVASILGFAMIANLVIAATFGTLVPVIMKKLGKDPASSATIFITTATDVFGFLAFLGLAALLLR
jgi:magnesium transporter